ncbi:phospho-sugar mutase [Cellulomonas xiejunii]|uniref:Phospho-sugar mutase n=1 Tax=Cellulomonas xiejunii TaxID=2968083 RepID=A0ABY5KVK5_9CELL|nr:phospho-sugar mutase [Cellulomonas xiejunii]MCC2322832.1 phospho-sugar mutase [Cellulomonas xiejunii]UUI73704.1 phospho-sugar mutase [Cellulomonas xiejunii]
MTDERTGTDGDGWARLVTQVDAWVADDPDPVTADELTALLRVARETPEPGASEPVAHLVHRDAATARAELEDRFSGLLQFGTAGLRGALGGGPHRMNRAVVIRAAAGLADFLLGELEGATPAPRVVVGYDARHNSHRFALDTAAVMTAVGIEVLLLPRALPTPVLARAVRRFDADAGVMVTASHNPPQDNGYKVYLGGRVVTDAGQGAQIVPPADTAIAAAIARVPSVASVPRASTGWTVLGEDVVDEYARTAAAVAPDGDADARARLKVVLTPLHGVGGALTKDVLARAGFGDVTLVAEQAEPDPDFPTVAFPNPEEPGATDLALALASAMRADLVVAVDPDADRCAVAVLDPRAHIPARGPETPQADGWRMLTGDEVGALLGADAADRLRTAGSPAGSTPTLACSIVSSRLLAAVAAAAGLRFASTLTGFKWISRVDGLVFGYEEALGYCVDPAHVRDKDGMTAAVRVCDLAARLAAQGRTLVDALDDLARAHGLHATGQVSARFADLSRIGATMTALREAPPATLAGSPVVEVVDLAAGTDDDRGGLPPTDGLRLLTADGTRVVVRPSGTEPKVKAYLEVVVPVAADAERAELDAAHRTARHRLDDLARDVRTALGLDGS